jgi:hypothetical protein
MFSIILGILKRRLEFPGEIKASIVERIWCWHVEKKIKSSPSYELSTEKASAHNFGLLKI